MSEPSTRTPRHSVSKAPEGHRAHSSCDRCRSRKTKCIDPLPGPCLYCARTGALCTVSTPRKRKPFYHVSEEEYQCSMLILEHLFPGHELNLQSLRTMAKAVQDGTFAAFPFQQTQRFFEDDLTTQDEEPSSLAMDDEEQDISELHEPLGYRVKKSRKTPRYLGIHSEIYFNDSVATLGVHRRTPPTVLAPRIGVYSPGSSTRSPSSISTEQTQFYLPAREICDFYVSRYLENVHCTYWLFHVESLLRRVGNTYTDSSPSPSSSWMCTLYAIFAIGAATRNSTTGTSPSRRLSAMLDSKTSEDYISLARDLLPSVYDEANINGIRALAIMSIVMDSMCSRVPAYLYLGASIQMAYTLGLHRDKLLDSELTIEREQNCRIMWTLFLLDEEIGSQSGAPNLIDEKCTVITTAMALEQVLSPGLYTPLEWLSSSISLSRFKREIISVVYTEQSANSISFSTVSNLYFELQKWYQELPAHLHIDGSTPPTQKRAVAILHLNYWGTLILLTRSFLLLLVVNNQTLSTTKKRWFEHMGRTCIDAAQKSNTILQRMAADSKLSSLVTFDSICILRVTTVFFLAHAYTRKSLYRTQIEILSMLIKNMDQVGFTKMALEEIARRAADLGKFDDTGAENNSVSPAQFDDELNAQLWGSWDANFKTPFPARQSHDLTLDDFDPFDMSPDSMPFADTESSIIADPSQAYTSYPHAQQ